MADEHHELPGGRLKGLVFSGLDGVLTSCAIVAGSVGAQLGPVAVLALGVANVVADAVSMGAGEFLSSRSYNAYVRNEREREAWELENYPAGEIAEMVELFVARGMSREDAALVIQRMAKYKDFFVDLMMTEELSLPVPSDSDTVESLKDGLMMFVSFASFGMVPIGSYVGACVLLPSLEASRLLAVVSAVIAMTLFVLGASKAAFNDRQYLRAGAETLLLGALCAAVAFVLGRSVSELATASELFGATVMAAAPQ